MASSAGAQVRRLSQRAEGGLLNDFLRLESATDRQILAFAKRWGPLQLCKHRRPYRHESNDLEALLTPGF